MPLPKQIDPDTVIRRIDPAKDVDGFHPVNVGKMLIGERDGFIPCTPAGIQVLLKESGVKTPGKNCVVIGRSNIVGKPMAALMMQDNENANCTVTVCHRHTVDLKSHTRAADNPISVGDLTFLTREVVESRMRPVWVRGEISDFKRHRNGHWYFCLRDRQAQIRCVVWSGDQHRMPAPPDDGMQVVLFGQMTVYTARADLQLKVTRIDAEGDGLWRKAMELTLGKLRQEGLLDDARKRPIPHYPRRIAVVTSPDGAAFRDIVAVMRKRNLGARLVLCPAKVQGDGAALEIAAALRRVVRWGKADVVIVGRGGGGKEDLWAFNDERVARAVVACPVPVISAVGHAGGINGFDGVAHLPAPTPPSA